MTTTPAVTPIRPRAESRGTKGRLVFVDLLRVAVICLVIAHHAGQAYGPTGGDWPVSDRNTADWLGAFFSTNAAFFMGLLFLLAGYFVPRSYDRRGAGGFLAGRWRRIGIPLVFFALLVHLPIAYLLDDTSTSFGAFVSDTYANGWQEVYIHLWFLGHLLLYSAVYVLWRRIAERRSAAPRVWRVPNHAAIAGFAVALALVTWVVRFWYPIDEWVPLFFVLAAEPAHLPQYASLFALGAVAYRADWFRKIPTATGMVWLGIGGAAVATSYALRILDPGTWEQWSSKGGNDMYALVSSGWEAVICVGLCVGLIVLFREALNRTNRVVEAMAAASYAAYILHILIVIGLQMGIDGVDWPANAKFGLVTALGIPLAFGIGHVSRRIPGLRVVLGTQSEAPPREAGEPTTTLRAGK